MDVEPAILSRASAGPSGLHRPLIEAWVTHVTGATPLIAEYIEKAWTWPGLYAFRTESRSPGYFASPTPATVMPIA